jgi:hypothetical protein
VPWRGYPRNLYKRWITAGYQFVQAVEVFKLAPLRRNTRGKPGTVSYRTWDTKKFQGKNCSPFLVSGHYPVCITQQLGKNLLWSSVCPLFCHNSNHLHKQIWTCAIAGLFSLLLIFVQKKILIWMDSGWKHNYLTYKTSCNMLINRFRRSSTLHKVYEMQH